MTVNALLFDLDNTLFDRESAFRSWAIQFIADELGVVDDAESKGVLAWMTEQDADGYGSKQAVFEQTRLRYPSRVGSTEQAIERMLSAFIENMKLDVSTVALLDRCDAAGIPYGIVTNGGARQIRKIERLGLDKRTDCVVISDVFGVPKPEPAIFVEAARQLGTAPGNTLFVGDHPVNDIVGAARVGMQTAWLSRGKSWPQALLPLRPAYTIANVSHLDEIVWPRGTMETKPATFPLRGLLPPATG